MKFEFKGQYIVAEAQTAQENIQLLALQTQAPKVKRASIIKRDTSKRNVEGLKTLKNALEEVNPGVKTLIPNNIASGSADFPAFAYQFFTKDRKRPVSVSRVFNGYEVTTK